MKKFLGLFSLISLLCLNSFAGPHVAGVAPTENHKKAVVKEQESKKAERKEVIEAKVISNNKGPNDVNPKEVVVAKTIADNQNSKEMKAIVKEKNSNNSDQQKAVVAKKVSSNN